MKARKQSQGNALTMCQWAGFMAVSLACGVAQSQGKAEERTGGYPKRPIRVLVGAPAGSGSDLTMRTVAQGLGERLGQTVVVDNRPGAAGAISVQLTAQAAPDGHTLTALAAQSVTAMLLGTVSTNIPRELDPVALMLTQPYLMVATPSLPANSVRELIALARAKPLVYASSGVGTIVHLGMEMFKSMANVDMQHVPYKGSGLSMIDVMSGRVQLAITNMLTAGPLARSGKIKALAITSPARAPIMPDVPTIAESGVPGYSLRSWYGLMAPRGTPPGIVKMLNREVNAVMNSPAVKNRLAADGAEVAAPNTPEQFRAMIAEEIGKWEKIVRRLDMDKKPAK